MHLNHYSNSEVLSTTLTQFLFNSFMERFFDVTQLQGHMHKVLSEIFSCSTVNPWVLYSLMGYKTCFHATGMDGLKVQRTENSASSWGIVRDSDFTTASWLISENSLYRFNGRKKYISKINLWLFLFVQMCFMKK